MIEQRQIAAHHEAAHAVARVILGANLGKTWIDAHGFGESEGFGVYPSAEIMACVSMAGPAVENLYRPRPIQDLRLHWVDVLLNDLDENDEFQPMLFGLAEHGFEWARQFIQDYADPIREVATRLLRDGCVSAADVHQIVGAA